MAPKFLAQIGLLFLLMPVLGGATETPAAPDQAAETKRSMVRLMEIERFWISSGIAQGRVRRFADIRRELSARREALNQIYAVSHLYEEGGLLQPAVIVESTMVTQADAKGTEIQWAEKRYQIIIPERLVTEPLNWYTFLVDDQDIDTTMPEPDVSVVPKTDAERSIAVKAFETGILEGAKQAEIEFQSRLRLLTTIVTGMINYHSLKRRGLVKPTRIAKGLVPVSGNETLLAINTRSLRIETPTEFQFDTAKYRSYVTPPPLFAYPAGR